MSGEMIDDDIEVCDMEDVPKHRKSRSPWYDKMIRNLTILKGTTKTIVLKEKDFTPTARNYLAIRVREDGIGGLRTARKDGKIWIWLGPLAFRKPNNK